MSTQAITLPFKIEESKPINRFPQLAVFMGLPKIGKSTSMAKLENALIVDLEGKGYQGIPVQNLVKATDLKTMKEVAKYFFSDANKDYKILVVDHLRVLTTFFSDQIKSEHDSRFVEEIPFGRGVYQLKNSIDSFVKYLNKSLALQPDKHVFLVAHANDRNGEIRLDIDGKNETLVLGLVDAVGYISRDQNDLTTITFAARKGVEFGCRNKNLAAYTGELDWKKLFEVAEK